MTQDQVEKFITELSSEIQKSFLGLKIIGWESVEYEFENGAKRYGRCKLE